MSQSPAYTPRNVVAHLLKYMLGSPLSALCLFALFVLVLCAVAAPLLAPFDPDKQVLEFAAKPAGFEASVLEVRTQSLADEFRVVPVVDAVVRADTVHYTALSGRHLTLPVHNLVDKNTVVNKYVFWLGSDQKGRDVLSRIVYGARVSLLVGFVAQGVSLCAGLLLGAIAGYYRGRTDSVIMWLINVMWSFPSILLAIVFSVVFGIGLWQTILAIGLSGWVDIARIVRGQFFSLREAEYIQSATILGFSSLRIIAKHMLPNALGPILVVASAGFANAIIAEAGLSFLGLGVQPPTSSFGQMIFDGRGYMTSPDAWGLIVFPGVVIAIAVFAFNLLGDSIRDALDPASKG